MPVDFKHHADDILDCAKFAFGEHDFPVIYKPIAGGSYNIVGIFENQYEQVDPDTERVVAANQLTLGVKLSDLPYAPQKGDKVIVRNVTYRVIDSQEDGIAGAILFLHKVNPDA